jgi:hypothetical protein
VFLTIHMIGIACPLINIKFSIDLKFDLYDEEFDSRTDEGLGHCKTREVLNDLAH